VIQQSVLLVLGGSTSHGYHWMLQASQHCWETQTLLTGIR